MGSAISAVIVVNRARRRASHRPGLYFRVPRVELLVVGEAYEDLIFVGLPRLPKAGEELRSAHYASTIGGGAVITAVAAARLGVRTVVVSALSAEASRRLRSERIGVANLMRPREHHAVTVALSTSDDRSFVTFNGVNDRLEPRLLKALRYQKARHVHFALAPQRIDRWLRVLDRFRADGVTTSWDFGWNPPLRDRAGFGRLISAVDVVFMNEVEATMYARVRRETRNTVIKLGSRGSRWVSGAFDITAPAPRVAAVDTTGAGDAFNGGFLCAFLDGRPPRECLRLGNYVGAQSTRAAGGVNALPTRPARPSRPTRPTRPSRPSRPIRRP